MNSRIHRLLGAGVAVAATLCTGQPAFAQSQAGQHATAGKALGTQGEKDWADARWNQTEVGPFLASSLQTPEGTLAKALSIRVGDKGEAAVCFDTGSSTMRAGWVGGFLKFDGRRFGLINAPAAAGEWAFTTPDSAGWVGVSARHEAVRLGANRVVLESTVGQTRLLESPWFYPADGLNLISRSFELPAGGGSLVCRILSGGKASAVVGRSGDWDLGTIGTGDKVQLVALRSGLGAELGVGGGNIDLIIKPRPATSRFTLFLWSGPEVRLAAVKAFLANQTGAEDLTALSQPGPGRWPALTTVGQIGFPSDGFAVDTITVPYANPWKALFFCSGVGFFNDGSAAVSTIHGDVWKVSGVDDKLRRVTWRRFATGLFQPLGLQVVNDRVHVLGRDQITILHDENGDGEADRYENFCNLLDTSTGGHDYTTSLERDAAGNFYYVDYKGVQRISADGKTKTTLATGLRNANGLGVGLGPIITVAPQQGEWTPSSVIFEVVKPGSHFGYRGPQVTPERPLGYDLPLCWLPHGFDNSSASQVWVPEGSWGPLGGKMLHLLWGRCTMALVLRDVVDGQSQGAAVALPGKFLSGPMRGTFNLKDGHLYIAGSTGWQTIAAKDGSLQRVRRTGTATRPPVAWHAHRNGLKLTFAEPLDPAAAEDPGSYALKQWNYRYAAQYGSKDWSVANPNKEGRDEVAVRSAKILPDGRSVFIQTDELKPVMQMELRYNLPFRGGASAAGPLYLTLNRLDAPF